MSLTRKIKPKLPKFDTPPGSPSAEPVTSAMPQNVDSRAWMNFSGQEIDVAADDLEILKNLGRGQYGQVDRVRHKKTGFEFAVKRIRSTDDPEDQKRMLMDMTVNNQSGGKCPYIVRSFGALFRDGDLWICMEVMDASLDEFYKKVFAAKETIPEHVLGHIAFAIVSGLQFLKQELNIIHRDVKPSNVLLSKNGHVKLCDFGISGQLIASMAKTRNIGCALYMPPERVDPDKAGVEGFGVQSDVWSVGITMIEVATGKHPFSAWKTPFDQMTQVVVGPEPRLQANGRFSPEFCDFIAKCCQKISENRPKYNELLEHPFISPYQANPGDISDFVQRYLS